MQSVRQALREATATIHARVHLHPGFAAIQNGTISRIDYRALLVRLYGFHLQFEAAAGTATDRSAWLQEDLATVSPGGQVPAGIPRCMMVPPLDTPVRRLGALYVVEGSALGGRHLARQLDSLFGSSGIEGRRFFQGRGADTDAAWRAFLSQLTWSVVTAADRRDIVAAAMETFDVFEQWLSGWRSGTV